MEKFRILHIGKYFPPVPGGMETFLADVLTASQRMNLSVAALIHDKNANAMAAESYHGYQLYPVKTYGEWLHTPIAPGFLRALRHAIEDFRPHILHLHLPNPSAFAVMFVASAKHLPWVVHWQSDVVADHDRILAFAYLAYRPFERALLKRSRYIIVNSPDYLAGSRALLGFRERSQCLSLGIDPSRLPQPSPEDKAWADQQWPHEGMKILAVGRLVHYKGFDSLLKAVALLPECQLIIAGGGPLEAQLRKLLAEQGLHDRAKLIGYLPAHHLQALMHSCEVVCLPSTQRSEAFGLVLLEAMHYGKAVVASDVPDSGMGWVVREGRHGLLAAPNDILHLAACLRRLATDEELRNTLSARGLQRFESHFHIDRHVERLALLYKRIMHN